MISKIKTASLTGKRFMRSQSKSHKKLFFITYRGKRLEIWTKDTVLKRVEIKNDQQAHAKLL